MSIKRGTIKVLSSISLQNKVGEVVSCSTDTGRDLKAKRMFSAFSSEIIISLEIKCSKTQVIDTDCDMEGKVMNMSIKVSAMYHDEMIRDGISKKGDDSLVPFDLWLYWLDIGLDYSLTLQQ